MKMVVKNTDKSLQGMVHEILPIPNRATADNESDPINIESTFKGSDYYDNSMYLKFNNAIQRMAEPREVEHTEVDVEHVVRNEMGSVFAVVIHYPDGSVDSDMLTKVRNGGWSFFRDKFRYHPSFVSAYTASIWGYKKLSELQIATEICDVQYAIKTSSALVGNFMMRILPGGVAIFRCVQKDDNTLRPCEAIDFVPYELMSRDELKDIYGTIVKKYASSKEPGFIELPGDLVLPTLELSLERLKKRYGDKSDAAG